MQRFYWSENQNARSAIERCAPSGPQKHITKETDGFHNHSNLITIVLKLSVDSFATYACSCRICSLEFFIVFRLKNN